MAVLLCCLSSFVSCSVLEDEVSNLVEEDPPGIGLTTFHDDIILELSSSAAEARAVLATVEVPTGTKLLIPLEPVPWGPEVTLAQITVEDFMVQPLTSSGQSIGLSVFDGSGQSLLDISLIDANPNRREDCTNGTTVELSSGFSGCLIETNETQSSIGLFAPGVDFGYALSMREVGGVDLESWLATLVELELGSPTNIAQYPYCSALDC